MMEDRIENESGELETVSAEQIRSLPDKKLVELANSVKGCLMECPECGEVTAFIGTPGYNDDSACHSCGYEARWL